MSTQPASREPLWRDEFSVHAADERYVSRRQFTKFLVLTSLAMLVGQIWILLKSWFAPQAAGPPQQAVARLGEIGIGEVKLFTYPTPQDHCILVRTAPETYAAYSQKCTHLSCAVYYVNDTKRFRCPCHNGYFAVDDGRVLAGPPRRPLPRIVLETRGGELIATAIREG